MDDRFAVTHEDGGGAARPAAPRRRLAHVALLVRDYDEALAWFVDRLGFHVVEDTPLAANKRWVLVAPPGDGGATLLLARAATPAQRAAVGRQGGGRVFLFLHTDDFARDHAALTARGVVFTEPPRDEAYGAVAVFEDCTATAGTWCSRGSRRRRGVPCRPRRPSRSATSRRPRSPSTRACPSPSRCARCSPSSRPTRGSAACTWSRRRWPCRT
jgi:catechol 2,3-dioxygenase-like lactoylglutathione lyase family enzyme